MVVNNDEGRSTKYWMFWVTADLPSLAVTSIS